MWFHYTLKLTNKYQFFILHYNLCLTNLAKRVQFSFQVHGGDFPHLLVYGPSGAGKKTRIMCLLRELYGSGVEKLRIEQHNFTTPSNKKIEISTISSNYHIEVNPRLELTLII